MNYIVIQIKYNSITIVPQHYSRDMRSCSMNDTFFVLQLGLLRELEAFKSIFAKMDNFDMVELLGKGGFGTGIKCQDRRTTLRRQAVHSTPH